ncbi:MAG: VOC family protein [Chloroflexota bacterium]|nr:MAG: VOC family protein [Chloroflexota bacterium]
MNSLSLDHVILVVSNLQIATSQFTQLGFSVIAGGVHSGGLTHNALIPFPDGTYLELLATTRSSMLNFLQLLKKLRLLRLYIANETAINQRLIDDLAMGIGMNDYSLFSMDLVNDLSLIKQRGATFTNPIPGGRVRPDGEEIKWRTAVPDKVDLPFLIDDLTPRDIRVPPVENDFHSNGVLGIKGITVLVTNLVESMAHYRALFADEPITQPQFPQPGTQSSEFNLDNRFLTIIGALPGNPVMRNLLTHRKARPVGIFMQSTEDEKGDLLSLTYLPERGATLSRSQILFS